MTLDEKIEELEKLEKAATPRDWQGQTLYEILRPETADSSISAAFHRDLQTQAAADAQFIAESRNSILAILTELKLLKEFKREAIEVISQIKWANNESLQYEAKDFLKRWKNNE